MKTTTTIRSTIFRLLAYSRIMLITATTSWQKLVNAVEALAYHSPPRGPAGLSRRAGAGSGAG